AAVAGQQFQTGFLCAEQERDCGDIFVRAGADVLAGWLGLRRGMERAKYRIAVADRVLEIILVDLQVAGDRSQHLESRRGEGREQLPEGVLEARYFGRPEVVGHVVAEAVAGRQVAADVPEFLE